MKTYEQSFTNQSVWSINHNLGSLNVIIDTWISHNGAIKKAIPMKTEIVDADNVTVTWSSARTGGMKIRI